MRRAHSLLDQVSKKGCLNKNYLSLFKSIKQDGAWFNKSLSFYEF